MVDKVTSNDKHCVSFFPVFACTIFSYFPADFYHQPAFINIYIIITFI